jgi:hypothetical protein
MLMLCLCVAGVSQAETVIIGGAVGNGDFEALITPGTGVQLFDNTVDWVNVGEPTGTQTLNTQASHDTLAYDAGSPRNIIVGSETDKIKWYGQNTGYTISSGDVFDISYVWRDAWGWQNDQEIEVFLFVTDTDDLTGVKTILVSDLGGVRTATATWEAVDHDGIYTAVAGDAGKTLMVGIRNTYDPSYNRYARLDNFELVSQKSSQANLPDPDNGETGVEIDLSLPLRTVAGELSWSAPDAYAGVSTYDIYFGTTEPNLLAPNYGLTKLNATPQTATSIAPLTMPLTNLTTYYWVVDSYEPNTVPILHAGTPWSFTTVTALPVINTDPVSQLVDAGTDVTLTVDGDNFTDADVTWYHIPPGGTATEVGTASKTLLLTAVGTSDEGEYYAEATNTAGSGASEVAHVMTKRLVAHWGFENNLVDSVDGLLTGTLRDPNTLHSDPTPDYVAGLSGQALSLVDLSDPNFVYYVEVPDTNDLLDSYPLGFTLSGWMKVSPGYLYSALFGKNERPVSDGFALIQGHDGGVVLRNAGGIYIPSSAGIDMGDGQWHFVAGVYDAEVGTLGVYTDGVLVEQQNVSGTLGPIDTSLILGAMDVTEPTPPEVMRNVVWPLKGVIDELRIWSYPRDLLTIAWDYNDHRPVGTTAPCVDDTGLLYDVDGDCHISLADFIEVIAKNWLNCREASVDCLTDPR